LKRVSEEIEHADGTLLENPSSQLIVPVLKPSDSGQFAPNEVCALIWLESVNEFAFDRDDAETLLEVADYIGVAMSKVQAVKGVIEGSIQRGQDLERNGLLQSLSRGISDPLQVAQSKIDLLFARLRRGDEIAREELEKELFRSRDCVEAAIQQAYQLRQITGQRVITIVPTELKALIEQALAMYKVRYKSATCRIERDVAENLPKVMVEPAEMRYVLDSLVEVSFKAVEAMAQKAGSEVFGGRVRIYVGADLSSSLTVVIRIEHNGESIPEGELLHVFDRYSTMEEMSDAQEGAGIRLWMTKRFIEGIGGRITVRNVDRPAGAPQEVRFQIVLPACSEDARPQEVTLA
jgi:two-component system, OmpR family, sensor histidine kinase KdpD